MARWEKSDVFSLTSQAILFCQNDTRNSFRRFAYMRIQFRAFTSALCLLSVALCGCLEIAERIVIGNDLKILYKTEIRLDPTFFAKAFERNKPDAKDVETYKAQLIEGFKNRMKVFDTLRTVEEMVTNVSTKDTVTVITAQLTVGEPKFLHNVNRLFWSGVVATPSINLPAFPVDINYSKKADTLPVLEFGPVAAKYQDVFRISNEDIEDADLYSRSFNDKLVTLSFKAPQLVNINGALTKETPDGSTWQYPMQDAIIFGRSQFKPVTVMFVYMGDTAKYNYIK